MNWNGDWHWKLCFDFKRCLKKTEKLVFLLTLKKQVTRFTDIAVKIVESHFWTYSLSLSRNTNQPKLIILTLSCSTFLYRHQCFASDEYHWTFSETKHIVIWYRCSLFIHVKFQILSSFFRCSNVIYKGRTCRFWTCVI